MGPLIVWGHLADGGWVDEGATEDFGLDLAYGIGKDSDNDFELVLPDRHMLDGGCAVYVHGTPYGGVVDAVGFDTSSGTLSWRGRTWQGVLAHRVLRPPSGSDYLTVSGTAADAIRAVLGNSGDLHPAAMPIRVGECPEVSVSYRFARYVTAWDGLLAALRSVGLRPTFEVVRDGGLSYVALGATAIRDVGGEVDSDLITFEGTLQYRTTEHLVAGGQGELAARTILDLYAHRAARGWTVDQTSTDASHPLEEVVEFYDYPSAEDAAELAEEGTERLMEYQTDGELEVELDPSLGVDAGDVVTAYEARLGVAMSVTVEGVVCKVRDGVMSVSYETAPAGLSVSHVTT